MPISLSDLKIPVVTVGSAGMAFAGFLWFASGEDHLIQEHISSQEKHLEYNDKRIDELDRDRHDKAEALIRQSDKIDSILESLRRIEQEIKK
jgi:hypothetical protein